MCPLTGETLQYGVRTWTAYAFVGWKGLVMLIGCKFRPVFKSRSLWNTRSFTML